MHDSLFTAVQGLLPQGQSLNRLEKLFGEASYREYFRAFSNSGMSFIVMKIPEGKQSVSEEITNYRGSTAELPFLNIARYLHRHQLPCPEILSTHLASGLLLLEDLGDLSLEKALQQSNPEMLSFFYRQAIELLVRLQKTGQEYPDPDCMAYGRSFDQNLLLWEFEHFLEYGIEDRFQKKIPQAERKEMLDWGAQLVASLLDIPTTLTHRDFQSRNLLLHGYQMYLIDFQDALLGPSTYDLVALLRDSYIALPSSTVTQLVDNYLQARERAGLPLYPREKFFKDFHRTTLQRKLKDAGRFQFIATVKKNSKFLPHVANTLKHVRQAFAALPEQEPLRKMLAKYVPELNSDNS